MEYNLAIKYNLLPSLYKKVLLEESNLSYRTRNALSNYGLTTVEDLLYITESEVLKMKNIGMKCRKEIFDFLSKLDRHGSENEPTDSFSIYQKDIKILRSNIANIVNGNLDFMKHDLENPGNLTSILNDLRYYLDPEVYKSCFLDYELLYYLKYMSYEIYTTINNDYTVNKAISKKIENLNDFYLQLPICDIIDASGISINLDHLHNPHNLLEISKLLLRWPQPPNENLIDLVEWCDQDINKSFIDLYNEICNHDRLKVILDYRAQNKTFEEIGNILKITRERVRQLENKCVKAFSLWNSKTRILNKISLLEGNIDVIDINILNKYLNENSLVAEYFLKKLECDFKYYKNYNLYISEKNDVEERTREYIDTLKEHFPEKDLKTIIKTGAFYYNLPEILIESMLLQNYKKKGDTYFVTHASLSYIIPFVLEKHYKNGIHVYNKKELEKFYSQMCEMFGEIASFSSHRALATRIGDVGILCDRGCYKKKESEYLPDYLIDDIYHYIENNEKNIIMIKSLYAIYKTELKKFNVNNQYYLQGILRETFQDKFSFSRDYVSKDCFATKYSNLIIDFIKKSHLPVTKDQLKENFIGISDIMLQLAIDKEEILNYFGKYFHVDNLSLSKKDIETLENSIIQTLIEDRPYRVKSIFEKINYQHPDLLSNNYLDIPYCLFSLLEYLFGDKFKFSRPYIANNNVELSTISILYDFINSKDEHLISDILAKAKSLEFVINNILEFLNHLNESFFLINRNQISRISNTGVDKDVVNKLEDVLETVVFSTIPIVDIVNIPFLPKINVPWTEWLIYSILYTWGERFDVTSYSEQFRYSTPIISPKNKMDFSKFEEFEINVK